MCWEFFYVIEFREKELLALWEKEKGKSDSGDMQIHGKLPQIFLLVRFVSGSYDIQVIMTANSLYEPHSLPTYGR